MPHPKSPGVQRLPRKGRQRLAQKSIRDLCPQRLSVYRIAHDRPAAGSEMDTDLVSPPGHQPAAQQAQTDVWSRDSRTALEMRHARSPD